MVRVAGPYFGVRLHYAGINGSDTPAGHGVPVEVLDPRPHPPVGVRVLSLICLVAWVVGLATLVVDAMWTRRLTAAAILFIGWTLMLAPTCWLAASGLATAWRVRRPQDEADHQLQLTRDNGSILIGCPVTRRWRPSQSRWSTCGWSRTTRGNRWR